MEVDITNLRDEMEHARAVRQNEEGEWDSISRLVVGRDRSWKHRTQDTGDFSSQGKTVRNYNSSPAVYQRQLAAALHVMLTNPAIRWFTFKPDVETDSGVKWGYDVAQRVFRYLSSPESMFPTSIDECYMDLASFGTSCMYARPSLGGAGRLSDRLVRFASLPIGSIAMLENDEGEVDRVFHDFKMKVYKIRKIWGNDGDVSFLQNKKDNEEIELVRAVFPTDYDPLIQGPGGMPWASVYMTRDGAHVIVKKRMKRNPFIISRFRKHAGAVWGDGPGHMALAATRTATAIKRTQLAAGSLATFPPMAVYANSMEGPLRWAPGAINYMRQSAREKPEPINTGADPMMGQALLEHELSLIREAFFVHLLMLPDRDRMTATEVNEHRLQKLETFSPIVSRLYAEMLTPVVTETYMAMDEASMLPSAPSDMEDVRLNFLGPLSQSQRATEGDSFTRLMIQAAPLIQIDPLVMQNLDSDATFRGLASGSDINPGWVREVGEVRQIRESAAQQEQQGQQQQAAAGVAGAFRDAAAGARDLGQL